MNREIVDGYLYEVTKSLSRKDKKAVYEKLEKEIYEKIDQNKKGPVETKEEILVVLKDYGNPADVAQKYTEKGNRALVPQPHYSHYISDKYLGLAIAIIFYGLIAFLSFGVFNTAVFDFENALLLGVDIVSIILVIYICYTLSFSWVSGGRLKSWDKFSKTLTAEPSKSSRVSAFEMKFQVVFSAILLVIFAFAKDLLGMTYEGIDLGNGYMLIFAPVIILVYFLSTLNIAYKEVDRKFTGGVLFSTIISKLAVIGLSFLLFVKEDALSSSFKSWLAGLLPNNDLMAGLVNNLGLVVFFVVVLIASIDIIATALGFHSNKKDSVEGIYQDDFGKVDVDLKDLEDLPEEVEPVVFESDKQTTVIEEKIDPLKSTDPVLMAETSDSQAPDEEPLKVHEFDPEADNKIDPLKSVDPVLMPETIEKTPEDKREINPDNLVENENEKIDPLKEVDTEFDPLGELDPSKENSIFHEDNKDSDFENSHTQVIKRDDMKKATDEAKAPTIADFMKKNNKED